MKLLLLALFVVGIYASNSRQTNFQKLKEAEKQHKLSAKLVYSASSYRTDPQPTTWECDRVGPVPANVRQQMRLSTFYRKYLHAFGIPIISSSAPSDAALRRACYVVVFLMADRKDVRSWLYKRNGRAGVVGLREGVTTIPEHSWLPAWWNQRARGLGGTLQSPISTCGEENIMCARGDRYPNEDIFLHEFVHGIHEVAIAARGAIPDYDGRIIARYNSLKRSGALWRGTYAMSTSREYLAEGTQSYFDVNDQNNHVHNHVDTRPELLAYDPTLYNFVKEIFPCKNRIIKRCEAKAGNVPASRYHFKMNCDRNGNGILMDFRTKKQVGGKPPTPPPPQTPAPGTLPPTPPPPQTPPPGTLPPTPPKPQTPPPGTLPPTPPKPQTPPPVTAPPTPPKPQTPPPVTAPPTPPKPQTPPPVPPTPPPNTPAPPVNCVDNHRSCPYWARIGECSRNSGYMKANCKKSCKVCGGGGGGASCVDKHSNCRSWASRGECYRNPAYMRANCKRSCSIC